MQVCKEFEYSGKTSNIRRHLFSFPHLKNALPSNELKTTQKRCNPKKFKKATKDFSKKDSEKDHLSKK